MRPRLRLRPSPPRLSAVFSQVVSPLGVAEPLPGLPGAEPKAERPSGCFALRPWDEVPRALSAVWARASTEQRDLLAELSVEVLTRGLMGLGRHTARARAISFRLKTRKMGRREKDKLPHWQCRWPNPHIGRYWKRQLSKARRRFAKQILLWGRGKEPLHYERECNWKTW